MLVNLGLMQASNGGILQLSGGTISGTGEVVAQNASTVELKNMNFDGVSLQTVGSGAIRDIATSTFTNLANKGNFEVAGNVTLVGSVNNAGEAIRVVKHGTVVLAEGAPPIEVDANGAPVGPGTPTPFSLSGGALLIDAGGTRMIFVWCHQQRLIDKDFFRFAIIDPMLTAFFRGSRHRDQSQRRHRNRSCAYIGTVHRDRYMLARREAEMFTRLTHDLSSAGSVERTGSMGGILWG